MTISPVSTSAAPARTAPPGGTAQIRAAAEGRIETADGEEVDQQTLEDVAKEIAVQEAIIYTGAKPGSADESLIRMGADVFMEKLRSWRQ